jgi:hypothetical protein
MRAAERPEEEPENRDRAPDVRHEKPGNRIGP